MISASSRGSFKNTESFFQSMLKFDPMKILETQAEVGVKALQSATPVESSLASQSWGYVITKEGTGYTITWTNSDVETGFPVAIMLQYGYTTGTGGYVQGRDYINPALKPVFDSIAEQVWKAVTSA